MELLKGASYLGFCVAILPHLGLKSKPADSLEVEPCAVVLLPLAAFSSCLDLDRLERPKCLQ